MVESVDLRRTAARGTLVNGTFLVGLNALQLIKNFLAAGLISTSAFGVWGLLTLAVGALTMLKDGLGNKYVQQEEEDQESAFHKAFTIELLANGALMVLMLVALPGVALLAGNWAIVPPGLVFIATMPAVALKAPVWIFYRDMRFGRQRLLESVDPVVSLAATVGLAVAGFGYWALVVGYFLGVWAGAATAVAFSPIKLKLRLDSETSRQYFSFTWPILIANGGAMLVPSLLILVGERTLGLAGAGMLTLAGSIANYANKVDQIITETMYPAICRVQDRTDVLYEAFVKSNRLDLIWGIPFGVGVALFASDLVEFGLGDKWRPGIIAIQALSLTAAANHLGYNWTAFLRARGDTKAFAIAGPIVVVTFLVVTIPLLILFEMKGLAVGMALMTFVSLLVRAHFLRALFPRYSMLRQAARGIGPVVPGSVCVLLLRAAATGTDRTEAAAFGELAIFLLLTVIATVVMERKLLGEMLSYLRGGSRPLADITV